MNNATRKLVAAARRHWYFFAIGMMAIIGVVLILPKTRAPEPPVGLGQNWPTQHPPSVPSQVALKYLSDRPPKTIAEYRDTYKEEPKKLLFVNRERRYYT